MKKDKNIKIIEEQKRDHAIYFVEEGEPGFSPERNKQIIENTIKKTDAIRAKKMRQYRENVQERADAVATYLKSRVAEGNTPIEKYFGKKWMSHLRGQKILQILKSKYQPKHKRVYPGSRQIYLPG